MRWMTALCLSLAIAGSSSVVHAADGSTIFGENRAATLRAMKKVQRSLGIKSCLHCHVKESGKVVYKTDTEHKKIARSMYFAFVDTLNTTGKANLEFADHGKTVKISAVRKAKGEDAGIHLTMVVPGKKEGEAPQTLKKQVALPAKDQPIECGTCHGGKLHFVTE
jgi:hypothetical protein